MPLQLLRGCRSRVGVALALLALACGPTRAAPAGFCETYTQSAIREYHRAAAEPACRHFIDELPIRWHADSDIHYNWCLANDRQAVLSERDARLGALNDCLRPVATGGPAGGDCCPQGMLICPMGRHWCR